MKLYLTQMDPIPQTVGALLKRKGWQVLHNPFRQVLFRENCWQDPLTSFDVVLLSSKNAARWLVDHSASQKIPPLAVVGEATAAIATSSGAALLTEPAPNAKALGITLQKILPAGASILYLCGATVTGDIEEGLKNYLLTKWEVYETQLITGSESAMDPKSMVYFQAPSTVQDFCSRQGFRPLWVAAIGPTTARALEGKGWKVDFQPSRPESLCFAREVPTPTQLGGNRSV